MAWNVGEETDSVRQHAVASEACKCTGFGTNIDYVWPRRVLGLVPAGLKVKHTELLDDLTPLRRDIRASFDSVSEIEVSVVVFVTS